MLIKSFLVALSLPFSHCLSHFFPFFTEKHFVDKHRDQLIQRVTCVDPILDALLKKHVLNQEIYDDIRSQRTPQAKIRELYSGPLKAGEEAKDIFKEVLKDQQLLLFKDLQNK